MKRIFFNLLSLLLNPKTQGISKSSLFKNWASMKLQFLTGAKKTNEIKLFEKKISGVDQSSLNYLYNEIFLKGEYFFESQNNEPIIFDCGSNIGMGILFFKTIYPKAKITGFEASPEVFEILNKNVSGMNLMGVEVHHLALYDQNTEITFYTGESNKSLLGSIKSSRGGAKQVQVKARRLSDFLKSYVEVDLIKIDVEGAEWKIMNDLVESGSLRKSRQYLIEFHLNLPEIEERLCKFLLYFEANGFTYNIRGEFGQVGEFQDLLIHFIRKD
jgi:FkbM family methyltransferase